MLKPICFDYVYQYFTDSQGMPILTFNDFHTISVSGIAGMQPAIAEAKRKLHIFLFELLCDGQTLPPASPLPNDGSYGTIRFNISVEEQRAAAHFRLYAKFSGVTLANYSIAGDSTYTCSFYGATGQQYTLQYHKGVLFYKPDGINHFSPIENNLQSKIHQALLK